jgi:tetratricopeptide (TPR) repeat protein
MTTNSFRGLLVATAAAAILAVSGAQAADAPKLSSGVAKQLQAAQKASGTQDWAAAKAAVDAAAQVSGRSDYDNYMIASFGVFISNSMGDKNGAATAAMAAADSSAQPDADKVKNLRNVVSLLMQTKQFDKAVPYAKTLAATNPTDMPTLSAIGQAYFFGKDYQDAMAIEQKIVDATVAGGKKPDRNTLEILLNSQVSLKDEAGAEKTLELLVANFNDPHDWGQIIDVTFSTKGIRDIDVNWLGRLLFLSGAEVSASDASMIGTTASHLGMLGDAQVAQQHGGTGFTDPRANADKDKATIKAQIAAGQKANGQYNIKLAEALYSYGMYPDAEATARLAIQKGGIPDVSEAPMVLGQSLTAQGKYDDAVAAFGQVTGGGPATPRIVRLWTDYANIKKNPPAPAPAGQ